MTDAKPQFSFALGFSLILAALVILGFGARAVVLPEYWPPVRATLIIHILVTGGWFALVVCQAGLIRRRRIAEHMRIGRYGVVLAALVLLTGSTMIVELNLREFSWLQIISNAINMITFSIFFGVAIVWRAARAVHMRMILFASLSLMTPAIARLLQPLGLEILTHPVWLLLCAGVVMFDLRSKGRVTPATWVGAGVSAAGFAVFAITSVLVAAPASAQEARTGALTDPQGYVGRVRLVRFLDEPDGYCIDVPGGAGRVFLNMPATAHTCHFDPLSDQIFHVNAAGSGRIAWDDNGRAVCLTAENVAVGSRLHFAACDGAEVQTFAFEANGEVRLAGTGFCLSVERTGPSFDETLQGDQDDFGRGRPVNPQYTHLARALELSRCGEGDPSMQRWMAYIEQPER